MTEALKNRIGQFILRIDLSGQDVDMTTLKESLLPSYDLCTTERMHNYKLQIPQVEVKEEKDSVQYVFSAENETVRLKLNDFVKTIIIEASRYLDNRVYKERVSNIIHLLKTLGYNDIPSRRIGLRYINVFPCMKITGISKIIKQKFVSSVIACLREDGTARSMQIAEFNKQGFMARVQYGVPNKFYPSPVVDFDTVLDIDVFSSGLQGIDTWEETISTCNHNAYEIFKQFICDDYLEKLK